MSERCALLLRAVNVSGRNRVPMAELRALLTSRLGLERVSTYIASGNVICAAATAELPAVCARVRALIAESFAVETPVIGRTHSELAEELARNPFPDAESDRMLHVVFLEATAQAGAEELVTARLQPGERIALRGRELWIDYGVSGAASTKLSGKALDRALGVAGTARNLRTVKKLVELTAPVA